MTRMPFLAVAIAAAALAGFHTITAAPPSDMAQGASKPPAEAAAPKPENDGPLDTRKPEVARPADTAVDDASDGRKAIGAVKCQIKIEGSPSQRSIIAMATASQTPRSGTFTLDIQKAGVNTAHSSQHGDFVLGSGETKRLAKVRISVGTSEILSGRLLLNTKDGDTVCEIK
jgi:hypothetical protein